MDYTWDPSFKPFMRYAYLGFLPPFSRNLFMGIITTCGICVSLIRAALILYLRKEEAFYEKVCNVAICTQQFARGVIFLLLRKPFHQFSYEINKFIKDQKFNPIINEEDYFLDIWKKSNAYSYAKWYMISVGVVCFAWKFQILLHLSKNYETVMNAYYILYSPYFAYSNYTKWIYTLADILMDSYFIFNVIHCEMVFLSFLNFLHCQFIYMKKLLDEISGENGEKLKDPKILKWWFENHCFVLRFALKMKKLLEPLIAMNYVCLIAGVASCIVILAEDKSVQSLLQKLLLIALFVIILFQLGVHCNTVEHINEVNDSMNEKINPYIEENKIKSDIIFSMINFISQKKIIFSGWGLFYYNNKDFKDLLMTTYSFYSTLMSFKEREKGG